MFSVTPAAQEQVAAYFEGKDVQPIRVFVHSGGCGGPMLAMAVDEVKDTDETFEIGGITYVIEKPLLAEGQPFEIDFSDMGFAVNSKLELGGGGCSGCSSSGGCGC